MMGVSPVCMSVYHVYATYGGQKRALELPELQLQTVVRHHVSAGKEE